MSIAILATGNEITCGDTLNTNAQFIAKILHSEGLDIGMHMACSDDEKDIRASLEFLSHKHQTIIIIGGLGPTSDDRTRFAVAGFLQLPLEEYSEAITFLQQWLESKPLNKGNLQQCLFPPNTVLFPNPHGTAQGCYHQSAQLIILLPGPPRECRPMVENYVLPLLQKSLHSDKQIIKWRLFGVAESEIGEALDNALTSYDCETGYRLETPYVEFKVKANPVLFPIIKEIIDPLVADYIIASPEKKASEILLANIIQHQIKFSIKDEITGGILETLLRKPETAHLIDFHNSLPKNFHLKGLDAYWQQQAKGQANLVLTYCFNQNLAKEKHTLIYRSPNIVHSAAEWVCYRINNLLLG